MGDDIVFDGVYRIVVDDVSDGKGTEFRASIYDEDYDLLSDAWGATVSESVSNAFIDFQDWKVA